MQTHLAEKHPALINVDLVVPEGFGVQRFSPPDFNTQAYGSNYGPYSTNANWANFSNDQSQYVRPDVDQGGETADLPYTATPNSTYPNTDVVHESDVSNNVGGNSMYPDFANHFQPHPPMMISEAEFEQMLQEDPNMIRNGVEQPRTGNVDYQRALSGLEEGVDSYSWTNSHL